MPINIPSGLYTGGRARLDLSPVVNTILKNRAAKKAASDAIIKNVQDQLSKVNRADIRDVDLNDYKGEDGKTYPGINSLMNQFKYNSIVSGVPDTETYNKIMSAAGASKRRTSFISEAGKAQSEGKLNSTELDVNFFNNLNKSIFDPTSKKTDGTEYNWNDLPANIPDVKPSELKTLYDVSSQGVAKISNPLLTKQDAIAGTVQLVSEHSLNDAKNIAQQYAIVSEISPSVKKYYSLILKDDNFKKNYEPDFEKAFGKKIETPQEAAMAYALKTAINDKKVETRNDPAVKLRAQAEAREFAEKMKKLDRAHQEKMLKMRFKDADERRKYNETFQDDQRKEREKFSKEMKEKYNIPYGEIYESGGTVPTNPSDPLNLFGGN